jgi:hypothetical protein
MSIAQPKTPTLTKLIPVGFKLPAGTRSNAKNLLVPGTVIDQSADPWSLCKDPWTNYPPPDKVVQFNQLICKRYGQPKPPDPLPHYGQTAAHLDAFQAALEIIAAKDPGWFKLKGFGPGPATPQPGETIESTWLERHDAQHAFNICLTVLRHGAELGLPIDI